MISCAFGLFVIVGVVSVLVAGVVAIHGRGDFLSGWAAHSPWAWSVSPGEAGVMFLKGGFEDSK